MKTLNSAPVKAVAPEVKPQWQRRVEAGAAALRAGNGVVITDAEDRENEGDLVFAAASITESQMALLIRECSGIVCLILTPEKTAALELPQMVKTNKSRYGTAFTVSIEAARGVTTGVSAADRVTTIRTAIAKDARPEDLNRPGHVFPLRARPGGVLERQGHTEATVDLLRIAGLAPFGVLCELTNPDGTMARLPEAQAFGSAHGFPWLTVADIVKWRGIQESIPEPIERSSAESIFLERIHESETTFIAPN